jgi:diguanylate cyclase (GGDEF)-like protein
MSNVPAPQGKLSATLVLDDAVRLAGEISSLLDGRLRLDDVQSLDVHGTSHIVDAVSGSFATLSIAQADPLPCPLAEVRVKISRQHEDSLTLEFAPSDAEVAARYREAITGLGLPGDRSTPRSDVVAASTEIAKNQSPEAHSEIRTPASRAELAPRGPGQFATPVTAEYAKLLDTIQAQSLAELNTALSPFFSDLTNHLLDLASSDRQGTQTENYHNEAALILQRNGHQIAQQMLHQLTDYFADLTPDANDDHLWQYTIGKTDKLDLIDLQEFEDFLAIDRMVTHGEDLHSVGLEALTFRIATLIGADANRVRLPIDVRQLCRAFQYALQQEAIPHSVLSPIFDYFSNRFVRQLDGFYDPLNSLLVDQGVLPDIEIEIETKGSLLERNRRSPKREAKARARKSKKQKPEDHDTDTPSTEAIKELNELHQQLGGNSPANLYRSVIDALNFKREAEGLADGNVLASGVAMSGTWDGATVASTELDQSKLADASSIAKALSTLQRSSHVRDEVQQSDSLRAYLASNKDQIGGLQDSSGLTTDSLNQLDMVDNLFGTIKSQLDVSADLKPALGNLQIPLAKLALLDSKFFVDHTHTARAVVDKLSGLATSANFPNKALEDRIGHIVDAIISDYENDVTVFNSALDKIGKLVEQQERALARNVERVVRTQEGQQTLADARTEVSKLIHSRVKPPAAPKVLQELIDSGWRDLLVLTHVREGPDSTAWIEQIKTLDLLCLWLNERQEGDANEDLSVQRSMEAEPFIDLIGQQISIALPTNIAHEEVLDELRDILSGNLEVEMLPVRQEDSDLAPEPKELRARIEDLPRLRRWVNRVEQLEEDSWLAYSDRTGQKKRMQLAWISPTRDRYIFVNERGQKVADLNAIRLARQLSRGMQPPAPADKLSVVDQSMYHTLEHVQKSLSFARNHDSLTRLINRETFDSQMQRALRHSQLKRTQHALLYLNIDQFKLVNEVYDKIVGDQVLLEFAKLLAQLHGKKSSSTRVEADEFAVLLLDQTLEQAVEIAEKIRGDIEAGSIDIDGESVSFTVSIGVAAILEHSPDIEEVTSAARSAMQHAKQRGRNQVVQYEEEQSRIIDFKLEKNRTREDLEDAIASERFLLRAQPIMQTAVSDRSNSTVHYELLLGLVNQDGSLSSPGEFIESAERYGFMTLVDRWVVREAFTWISRLMDEQKVVPHLAINLSGASVTDNSFMEYLLEQISEFGVGTSRLCFEITETGTISNLVKAADFVRVFRNIGCKFSIDDFGTGLASHNYLRELPVDYVKIDGSFITGIDKNRNDYAMARSINDLAHFLGQETIAESVESDTIIVKLEELGVDYLQGWGVGRPKPLEEVTAELSSLEK